MLLTPAEIKPNSFESERSFFLFLFTRGVCVSCLRACVGARLLAQYQNLSEGADHVGGQLRGDKECPVFSVVTKSGRVWRKVPESDAQSVGQSPNSKYWFTTSFLQRCRQAMIGVWASPCAACHISVLRRCHFIPVKVPESDARSVGVLAESEKRMQREPRVTESGRETVEGFEEDEKGKRRASVLSSLSLSRCLVIHLLMSSVHALRSLVRLVTSLKRADFWSCVSFVKS